MNHGSSASSTDTASCEVSMLWNWNTVDACVLTNGWHVTGRGLFAVTCISVAAMAMLRECVLHLCVKYDHLVKRQLSRRFTAGRVAPWAPARATAFQQALRAVMHMASTALGFLLMLILMSFNGYIFISVLLGHGLGKYFCDWITIAKDPRWELPPPAAVPNEADEAVRTVRTQGWTSDNSECSTPGAEKEQMCG